MSCIIYDTYKNALFETNRMKLHWPLISSKVYVNHTRMWYGISSTAKLRCVLSWCSKSLFCYYDRMCHDGIKPVLVFFFLFLFFLKFKTLQINVYIKKSVSPKRCQSDASIARWIWFVTSLLMSLIFYFYTEIVLVNIWDRESYIN